MTCRDEPPTPIRRDGPCSRCRRRKIKCDLGRPGEACSICLATGFTACSLLPPELQSNDKGAAVNPYGDGRRLQEVVETALRRRQPPPPTDRMSLELQLVIFSLALALRNRRERQKQLAFQ